MKRSTGEIQFRNTRQGRTILEILSEHPQPLSALELHARAKVVVPEIGIATVYRHLQQLIVVGQVVVVELPSEPARYERANKPHHHYFFCEYCRRVFDLPGCVPGMTSILPDGFRVAKHELTLYGACRDCSAADAELRS